MIPASRMPQAKAPKAASLPKPGQAKPAGPNPAMAQYVLNLLNQFRQSQAYSNPALPFQNQMAFMQAAQRLGGFPTRMPGQGGFGLSNPNTGYSPNGGMPSFGPPPSFQSMPQMGAFGQMPQMGWG